jgi:hypothetical protein
MRPAAGEEQDRCQCYDGHACQADAIQPDLTTVFRKAKEEGDNTALGQV